MYAVITGASSGIGREIAFLLAEKKYNLVLTARRLDRLKTLQQELRALHKVEVQVYSIDLSNLEGARELHEKCKDLDVQILINNAGFGKIGRFWEIGLEDELDMISTNISALHALTKLFINSMERGRILNVASMAAFQPDPNMAAYGATKSYVLNFSRAVGYELKRAKRDIHISVLCPGPVNTEFNDVAEGHFNVPSMSAEKCAQLAVKGLFKNKPVIVTGFRMKVLHCLSKIAPTSWILPVQYKVQSGKMTK